MFTLVGVELGVALTLALALLFLLISVAAEDDDCVFCVNNVGGGIANGGCEIDEDIFDVVLVPMDDDTGCVLVAAADGI